MATNKLTTHKQLFVDFNAEQGLLMFKRLIQYLLTLFDEDREDAIMPRASMLKEIRNTQQLSHITRGLLLGFTPRDEAVIKDYTTLVRALDLFLQYDSNDNESNFEIRMDEGNTKFDVFATRGIMKKFIDTAISSDKRHINEISEPRRLRNGRVLLGTILPVPDNPGLWVRIEGERHSTLLHENSEADALEMNGTGERFAFVNAQREMNGANGVNNEE